ncbi:UbiX family flavin prenyltransferase [Actinocrispum sp. NPDC049592]|uniref:UbiX family flavin prenyltransferase n=1 Tax=Actinocrispum sp. NPDC049592 TaxID=3154835 RepID=UPI00341CAFB4
MRIVVGITGATGSVIGVRILRALRELEVETHLVISKWGRATLELETDLRAADVHRLADHVYGHGDAAAAISSGSFRTDGMIIAPCSMKTLAAIRSGYGEGLIPRAADVTLKERRKLVLVPRELPLSEIHLDNMLALTRMGAVIAPPTPAFYTRPSTIDELITHIAARVLDQFGLDLPDVPRWTGPQTARRTPTQDTEQTSVLSPVPRLLNTGS